MTGAIVIAVVIATATTALLLASPSIYARYIGPSCPACGVRRFDCIDSHMFYDPAPDWALYRCDNCGSEFVRDRNGYTPRSQCDGDPDAEELFQSLAEDNQGSGQ
jgi:DNA-directed RNA polymerase subunit RPC12/RpoP